MKTSIAIAFASTLLGTTLAAPAAIARLQSRDTVTLFPNYLVPLNQSNPDFAYPTQFTARISYSGDDSTGDEVRMLVGFDVPANGNDNCAINFALPAPVPGGYPNAVTGSGKLDVFGLSGTINSGTTSWNNRPARVAGDPSFTITEPLTFGDAVVTGASIPCAHGQRMDFEVLATRAGATYFDLFELSDPKTGFTLEMS